MCIGRLMDVVNPKLAGAVKLQHRQIFVRSITPAIVVRSTGRCWFALSSELNWMVIGG